LFDYSNASVVQSQRAETTVPSQALFMLNSDLVMEVSRSVVERLEHQAVDFEERGRLLHLWVLGREPTAQEQRLMISLIDPSTQDGSTEDAGAQRRAWQLYAQALLSSNEFLYLR
jgi:hypothetical protein